jgi:diguanylate cyclase (GGDEF)-like protein
MHLPLVAAHSQRSHVSFDRLLRSAFAGITLLLLTVSVLGIWGIHQVEQPLDAIAQHDLPELQAIADARIALLTQESDDRQILFETNAAQYDADLDLLPADEQFTQAAFMRVSDSTTSVAGHSTIAQLGLALDLLSTLQNRFYDDLRQRSASGYADALGLEEGTGALRQQGWVVVALLTQLQNAEQAQASASEASATLNDAHLFGILLGVTAGAFLLTIGLGVGVSRYIGRMHRRQVAVNRQLAEALDESSRQGEEIHTQKESLLVTNAELARTIEAREAAEEQLAATLEESQQARSLLATIFETVRDGIAVSDQRGAIVYRNTAYQCLMNLPAELSSSTGDSTEPYQLMTMDGDRVPHEQHPALRIARGDEPDPPTIYQLSLADGTRRIIQMEAVPLAESTSAHLGALCVARDITAEYRDARNSEILRSLAHECACAPDEASIARAAVQVLTDGFGFTLCIVLMCDREREGYARVMGINNSLEFPPEDIQQIREALESTPIAPDAPFVSLRALADNEARFDVSTDPARSALIPPSLRSVSYVPIRADSETLGVLLVGYSLQRAAIWDEMEQDLLQAVVDELGLALHRARLYEDTRRLAFYDPLTGLHNHRSLQQALLQAIAEAESRSLPLSVIMLDIDHFRRFNENYGHDIGDLALRTAARAIQSALRPYDFAARYGGEEFTILLPGISDEQALKVAERVRETIASHLISVPGVADSVPITASLGVATFPRDAVSPAELLKAADIALYAAKHRGRNCVVAYETSFAPSTSLKAS